MAAERERWRAVFDRVAERLRLDHPTWEPQSIQAEAFEEILVAWRFSAHATPPAYGDPAPAVDGVIALANWGIMAPISEYSDISSGGARSRSNYRPCFDAHCQLRVAGEMWTIEAILPGLDGEAPNDGQRQKICLVRGWPGEEERVSYTMRKGDWAKYVEKAVAEMQRVLSE